MKLVSCAITVALVAACAKANRPATPASSDSEATASTASNGSVGRPVVPEPTAASDVATGVARPNTTGAPAQAARSITRIAGPSGVLGSKRTRAATVRDSASARDTGSMRDTGSTRDTGSAASSGASTPSSHASDSVKVNQFMSYDKAKKTVTIDIFAAYNTNLGGFNFNGGYSGNDTITVPQGWSVTMPVVNKDAIPHSAIIIKAQMPLPVQPHEPAIQLAYTTHLTDGLAPQGGHDTMRFKASPVGEYFLACGVPGHATSGMYIRFNVSSTATVPTYATQSK